MMNFIKKNFIESLVKWLEEYFLGIESHNRPKPYHQILIDSSDIAIKDIEYQMETLFKFTIKPNSLLFISPHQEPVMEHSFKRYFLDNIIALYPRSISDINKMTTIIDYYLYDVVLLICFNISQLPAGIKDNNYDIMFNKMMRQLYILSVKKSWPLILIDNDDNLSNKNSAIIRRLFIR